MGRSNILARWVKSPSSNQERDGGSSVATETSVRGECSEDGWVPCGGEVPLSQWFLTRVVLLAASFVESILSG